MDVRRLIHRGKQFGGLKLFLAYYKLGVGGTTTKQLVKVLLCQATPDEAYNIIRREVCKQMILRYADYIKERETYYDGIKKVDSENYKEQKIWTCWLQGFNIAPELVKVCQESMKRYLIDKEIIQLDYTNYANYVKLPEYIIKKYEDGKIPAALFTDLLRIELLIKYGGTWLDATILCTEPKLMTNSEWIDEIFNCDLFMFQSLRKEDNHFYGASNWFITARANNKPLMVLRDVLYQYWRDNDVTLDYYMFHDFFYTIAQLYPEEIAAMPRKNRLLPLMLMQRLDDEYDEKWMEQLQSRCCYHKLNYRMEERLKEKKGNFYNAVVLGKIQ